MSIPHLNLRGIALVLLVCAGTGTATLVGADDDLLDPSLIGAAQRAQAADDLLDPASLRPSRDLRPQSATTAAPTAAGASASYARSSAESTVRALDSLTQALAERADEIEKLDREALVLESKLDRLTREKAEIMEEYRNGLFCSGCNKTKAQILAEGDQFPHPGQHIIQPTLEQIAAKERELQSPIDQARRDHADNRARQQKLNAELDEAGAQSLAGVAFWSTCISLEQASLAATGLAQRERFQAEWSRIEDQLQRLAEAEVPMGDPVRLAEFRGECDLWIDLQERLERQHDTEEKALRLAAVHAGRAARDECAQLNSFIRRGPRSTLPRAYLGVTVRIVSSATNRDLLGGRFRMGDFQPANRGQTRAGVTALIDRFAQVPAAVFNAINPDLGNTPAPDSTTDDLLSSAARLLRETVRNRLPKEVPSDAERNHGTTGNGVRG